MITKTERALKDLKKRMEDKWDVQDKEENIFEKKVEIFSLVLVTALSITGLYYYLYKDVEWLKWLYYTVLTFGCIRLYFKGFKGYTQGIVSRAISAKFPRTVTVWAFNISLMYPVVFYMDSKFYLASIYTFFFIINSYAYAKSMAEL